MTRDVHQALGELYPFVSRYRDVIDARMHYLDEGRGAPVVMLHGNPSWSFLYRDLVRVLAPTRRCLVPDHVGMGLSQKPQAYPYTLKRHIDNLENLLAATLGEDEPVDLVVHDWGGAVGCGWAVRHPRRVRSLVVMNTAAFPGGRIPRRIAVCRWPFLGALAVRGLNGFVLAATRMTTLRPLAPQVKAGYLFPYDSWASRIGILRFVQDIPLHAEAPSHAVLADIENKLASLRPARMLLLWGMRDWCFTPAFLRHWKAAFPQAATEEYDAGHYVLEDVGDPALARIAAFLDEDD